MGWDSRYENDFIEIDDSIFDPLEEQFDEEEYFDNTARLLDELEHKEIEKIFSDKKGTGVEAHAYRHNLDNNLILQLWRQGWTLRKIGAELKCSPNTVRNRIQKMGYNTDRKWRG